MPITQPSVGCAVRIKTQGQTKVQFKSRVSDFDEQYLYVEVPIHVETGRELDVRVGDVLTIEYVASGSEVYRYSSPVLGLSYIPTPALRLIKPDEADHLERIQRREFYRISLDAVVHVIRTKQNITEEMSGVDISGGGLAVWSKQDPAFNVNEIVRVNMVLPYIDYRLDVQCRVIRTDYMESQHGWVVSMQFHDIPERERQQIVRYTFMRQRALKR